VVKMVVTLFPHKSHKILQSINYSAKEELQQILVLHLRD
jgi:hypothetical protein